MSHRGNQLLFLCILVSSKPLPASEENEIESFTLKRWNSDETWSLADQTDDILILDFFAYWCIPCLPTSQALESEIHQYYHRLGGNANGLTVNVVSINVEADQRARTQAFIDRAGARLVLDDPGGSLLKQLGGVALPYIVVLQSDGSGDSRSWKRVYRRSGYEGTDTMRQLIDSLEPKTIEIPEPIAAQSSPPAQVQEITTPPTEQPLEKIETAEEPPVSAEPVTQVQVNEATPISSSVAPIAEPPLPIPEENTPSLLLASTHYFGTIEVLSANDITVSLATLERRHALRNGEWSVMLNAGHVDIDYEPFSEADVIGIPNHLKENNAAVQVSRTYRPTPFHEYSLSAGGYHGFTDHRSLWLDEYYRQQFSGLEGYSEADPWGYNVSGSISWDTTRAPGILSATLIFQQDDVAPGYDRPLFQPLERGRERLHTGSALFEQESVLTKTTRWRNQLQLTRTTDRELRFRYSSSLNQAVGENWVLRIEGAGTYEAVELEDESDFKSHSVGIVLERDWNQEWFLGINGRRYSDNGQIETSILVSSGPPPLDTEHLGIHLIRQSESGSWKLAIAAYSADFDAIDSPIRPFGNLYRDRNWTIATTSYNRSF